MGVPFEQVVTFDELRNTRQSGLQLLVSRWRDL